MAIFLVLGTTLDASFSCMEEIARSVSPSVQGETRSTIFRGVILLAEVDTVGLPLQFIKVTHCGTSHTQVDSHSPFFAAGRPRCAILFANGHVERSRCASKKKTEPPSDVVVVATCSCLRLWFRRKVSYRREDWTKTSKRLALALARQNYSVKACVICRHTVIRYWPMFHLRQVGGYFADLLSSWRDGTGA